MTQQNDNTYKNKKNITTNLTNITTKGNILYKGKQRNNKNK